MWRSGATYLARRGHATGHIQWLERLGSAAVLGYVEVASEEVDSVAWESSRAVQSSLLQLPTCGRTRVCGVEQTTVCAWGWKEAAAHARLILPGASLPQGLVSGTRCQLKGATLPLGGIIEAQVVVAWRFQCEPCTARRAQRLRIGARSSHTSRGTRERKYVCAAAVATAHCGLSFWCLRFLLLFFHLLLVLSC